jgi:folylpolyglutamate synthase/dihydropteroate synthase
MVAGTNGKGSTCAMLESVLLRAGYKVGLYIKPHFLDFNERAASTATSPATRCWWPPSTRSRRCAATPC